MYYRSCQREHCNDSGIGSYFVLLDMAVYENGVLKPVRALPLDERQKVEITVKAVPSRVRQTAGFMGWTGSQQDADFVATSPELDPQEDE